MNIVSDVIPAVRVCLDEIGVNDASFVGGTDDNELDTIIESKVLDALTFVLRHADWGLIGAPDRVLSLQLATERAAMDDGSEVIIGVTELPDDFLRLSYVKAESWYDYVTEPVYWTDREYRKLHNVATTGYPDNPKAAIVLRRTGTGSSMTVKKYIELYSVVSGSDRYDIAYMKKPDVSGTGGSRTVSVPAELENAFIYYVAGLTLLTLRDEHADSLFNQALVLMGAHTGEK